MNTKNIKKMKKRQSRFLVYCIGITVSILVLAYIGISWFYSNHFYSRTYINGVDCSNLTIEQAKKKIREEVDTYVLTIQERNEVSEQLSGELFDLKLNFDDTFGDLLVEQSPLLWIVNSWNDKELESSVHLSFNEDKLQSVYEKLLAFDERYVVTPTDAYISKYDENSGFTIIPENIGNEVKKEEFYQHVVAAVKELNHSLSIEETQCYIAPNVTSSDKRIVKAVEVANLYSSTRITYNFGETTEVLDGSIIGPAIVIDENYNVSVNESKVKDFVDYIGKTYNSFGKTRTFMTSYGVEATIKGGDYGWWLDRETERKDLMDSILLGEQKEREPVYFQTAKSYDTNDFGNTYVEINLTAQHLFFYKDGELVVETDFVSGSVAKNYATPTGTYSITYKKQQATLNGEDYSTPVEYWMPFNKNIGLHDATWRSRFGGNIFLNNGSHGCINLPPAVAEKIYGLIEQGDAVLVYELAGTESYTSEEMAAALAKAEQIKKEQEGQEQQQNQNPGNSGN